MKRVVVSNFVLSVIMGSASRFLGWLNVHLAKFGAHSSLPKPYKAYYYAAGLIPVKAINHKSYIKVVDDRLLPCIYTNITIHLKP